MWLHEYYSGLPRKVIAERLFRSENALVDRIRKAGLPRRPRGQFTAAQRDEWLARPEIKALRDKYMPSPSLVPE